MGIIVCLKDEIILKTSSSVFQGLFDTVLEKIDEEKIELTEPMQQIINEMESCTYNLFMEFEKHIKNKSDFEKFMKILDKALKRYYQELPSNTEEKLQNFYRSLERAVLEEHKLN